MVGYLVVGTDLNYEGHRACIRRASAEAKKILSGRIWWIWQEIMSYYKGKRSRAYISQQAMGCELVPFLIT